MRLPQIRRPDIRLTLAKAAFLLAAVVLAWPIHIQAVTGASLRGAENQFTFSNFTTQSCPWQIHLGYVPNTTPAPPPANSDALGYLESNYNDGLCAAKRYDRTSQALLWMIIGTVLTVSGVRRRAARERAPRASVALA